MWIEHSKTQPTDDKPSLKWALSGQVAHFKFLVFDDKLREVKQQTTSSLTEAMTD